MDDLPIQEYIQDKQQRFEAALKFMSIKMEHGNGKALIGDSIDESIQLADLLIAELEKTRTKT